MQLAAPRMRESFYQTVTKTIVRFALVARIGVVNGNPRGTLSTPLFRLDAPDHLSSNYGRSVI